MPAPISPIRSLRTRSIKMSGRRKSRLETLEPRCVLTAYTVTDVGDAGVGTLRWAIDEANTNVGTDSIDFDLAGAGPHTISVLSPLPSIYDQVLIDGTTQPGYAGSPQIFLDGALAGPGNGFDLSNHTGSTITGLAIGGFEGCPYAGFGIVIFGGGDHTITANYLGTDVTGTTARPNCDGVFIINSSHNRIGTDGDGNADEAEGNLLSGNIRSGLMIESEGMSTGTRISGNRIGTDLAGSSAVPNQSAGILLNFSHADTLIGTDGVGNTIAERNLISGNQFGIQVLGGARTTIAGNYIGTNLAGDTPLANLGNGIGIVYEGSDHIVGTNGDGTGDSLEGNLIVAGSYGIVIQNQPTATGVRIAGNLLGTTSTGDAALPSGTGIFTQYDSRHLTIGTNSDGVSDTLERNVIVSTLGNAVDFRGGGNNVIAGNLINTDATGTTRLADTWGIFFGEETGQNRVGTDGDGVQDAAEGNVIATGILMAGSNQNVVAGNLIGTDVTGTTAIGVGTGVHMHESSSNRIGTDGNGVADLAERNVISGMYNGVGMDGGSNQNQVTGNYIGTDVTGLLPLPHLLVGAYIGLGASNRIGGPGVLANTIAFNGSTGVALGSFFNDPASGGNSVRYNRIHSNGLLGIDLGADQFFATGVLPNDPGDADEGFNGLQNYPELTGAYSSSVTRVVGSLDSLPNATYILDFYANSTVDASGYGEGERYLGSISVTTDGNGLTTYDEILNAASSAGEYVTATATDANDSTSEFSLAMASVAGNLPPVASLSGPTDAVRGQTVTFIATATDEPADEALGFEYQIDWGDGSSLEWIAAIPGNGSGISLSHVYSNTGVYAIALTATDSQSALSAPATHDVSVTVVGVQPDPCDCGVTLLVVGGTVAADEIHVRSSTTGWSVKLNGSELGPFPPTDRVVVFAQAGDDDVQVSGNTTRSAWLYAGAGDDRIKGGRGDDVILGEAGDDLLVGGDGRDLLIGGFGADRLVGNSEDDLLVAGWTDFDQVAAALCAIQREWTRDTGYLVRTAHLSGAPGGVNQGYYLQSTGPSVTVHDDNARDLLTGSAGQDWFFANRFLDCGDDAARKDEITDLHWWEFAADLDFIGSEIS